MKVNVGELAPDFSLPDQDGTVRRLADYRGQWVLVYFYPRDATPGCTLEACAMRDSAVTFKKMKLQVLGISTDKVASHRKFADKQTLNFPILADENKEVVNLYGVWAPKKFMGREFLGTLRQSVLIAPDGRVAKVYEAVRPAQHAEEVIGDAKELQA